ncbi:MAG: isoprenoid biosynthesis glyoxalase ElbB [Candidatus Marinimicrobia bacterium]|jgi:enhancing lycopene biosynthesis protein 2|nr:isoprenoid biosynthesis glyoxalase ElbB [Candidatus Neomarinimicrobiota bacterium]MBT3630997.1 isoprenoid biosynthesis glyoxalase ElbB [Candidatus Neomarinimicrobiota bacterium]MBT3824156.1 isoprenoid biosynthesis glyoxalase ElbB [Candidatus Neomarinimicrobiota bacterium]MBT4130372.1 isoprenoid biosynthesis glyoxalase ElbB [Candidatus Neomarinimicrobiota bacterium]MBT4295623.1 isoprenoid biosynthesis glyoxalase ElbB [Candidatus Neomarinimicrobiota bacterium]
MKKIAVVLSGSGFLDGAEIQESVITMLALDRAGVSYQCMAPDMEQMHVVNHFTGEVAEGEQRNVLVEAARIARTKIIDIAQANPNDYDAVIFPGGYGAAKNLSNFAVKGATSLVQTDVLQFARAFAATGKPMGFICIAPAMIPHIYGADAKLTIGSDAETAAAINEMGGVHINCPVDDFVVDEERNLVSTPAYMLDMRISEVATGIEKLVHKIIEMIYGK